MTTKHRFRNKYALQLREHDHNPPHVHLTGCGFDVLIYIETLTAEGLWPRGIKREVIEWISTNRNDLLKEWNQWPRK